MEKIGRKIVKQCGGLPLAVTVIGGILRRKSTWNDWDKVNTDMISYLKRGEGVEKNQKVGDIFHLSYDVLPFYLKQCFLYIACYPEDKEIETEELYSLWMAEGLVSLEDKERNESLRDVSQRYLSELVSRCMVHVKKDEESAYNRFRSCRLHDVMRDLCLEKAEKEELLVEFVGRQLPNQDASLSRGRQTRRLVVHLDHVGSDCSEALFQHERYQKLRTILFLSERVSLHEKLVQIDFGMFKVLRTLALQGCKFEDGQLPNEISKLILLKHLSIRCSDLKELPSFVCKLPRLQTLEVQVRGDLEIPKEVEMMSRLRHLVIESSCIRTREKLEIDGLKELETFRVFHSRDWDATGIIKLRNLRRFKGTIEDIRSACIIAGHIYNLKDQLQETELNITIYSEEVSALLRQILVTCPVANLNIWSTVSLPDYEPQLGSNLVSFTLACHKTNKDPMEMLGQLPRLRELILTDACVGGQMMVCRATGFSELRSLLLKDLSGVKEFVVEDNAMPNLNKFTLCDLYDLEEFRVRSKAMPEIEMLKLKLLSNLRRWIVGRTAMLKLFELKLKNLPSLEEWITHDAAMRNLHILSIRDCRKLKRLPSGLKYIKSLRWLNIENMPQEFKDTLRVVKGQRGDNYYIVQHIENINIY